MSVSCSSGAVLLLAVLTWTFCRADAALMTSEVPPFIGHSRLVRSIAPEGPADIASLHAKAIVGLVEDSLLSAEDGATSGELKLLLRLAATVADPRPVLWPLARLLQSSRRASPNGSGSSSRSVSPKQRCLFPSAPADPSASRFIPSLVLRVRCGESADRATSKA